MPWGQVVPIILTCDLHLLMAFALLLHTGVLCSSLAEKHPHFYNEAAIWRSLAPHSPLSQFSDNYLGSDGSGDVLISISYLLCYLGREGGGMPPVINSHGE